MWKKINREEIHNYSVGDKVRIDGVEDVITYIYPPGDDGFKTQSNEWKKGGHSCIFATYRWEQHQVEVWDEQSEQGESKMTPCKEKGYKVGDRFKVEECVGFSGGSVVELYEDDGSRQPLFKLVEGLTVYNHCNGEPGAYAHLKFVTKIDDSNKEESVNRVKLEKGMYLKLEGMTEEDFDALVKLCKRQGIHPWGDVREGLSDCKKYNEYLFIDNEGDLVSNENLVGTLQDCVEYLLDENITPKLVDIDEVLGKSEPVNVSKETTEDDLALLLETIKVVGNATQRISNPQFRNKGDDLLVALINKAADKFL